jgi:hypothetical protein
MPNAPKNSRHPVAGALAALATLGLVVAGCGSKAHASTASTTTSGATTTFTTTSTGRPRTVTAPRTTGTSRAPATVTPPAGGPVPSGFDPTSFSAISAQQFWLLGTAPCRRPVCTSIVRTTDGGKHFVGIPAPAAPLAAPDSDAPGVSTLAFANRLDGFAYGTHFPHGGPLWATQDGGAHWHQSLSHVLAFATAGGTAYAITGSCANGRCSGVRLQRSPVSTLRWSTTAIPVAVGSSPITITAHGASVWASLSPASHRAAHQTLVYSGDRGVHLKLGASPCLPDLGGTLAAVSATALWAVCPTGMQAAVARSTDSGAHWRNAGGGLSAPGGPHAALDNSAQLAAVNASTAVLAPGNGSELVLTTDGGRVYNQVFSPGSQSRRWSFIGFTDPSTGSGLLSDGAQAGPGGLPEQRLWRTANGGVRWSGPVRIG